MHGAWEPVALAVFAMAFAVPFVVLLSRAVKTWAPGLTLVAAVAFTGMWLERFILVAPSLWHGEGVPLGLLEILVTAGVAEPVRGLLHHLPRPLPHPAGIRPAARPR